MTVEERLDALEAFMQDQLRIREATARHQIAVQELRAMQMKHAALDHEIRHKAQECDELHQIAVATVLDYVGPVRDVMSSQGAEVH